MRWLIFLLLLLLSAPVTAAELNTVRPQAPNFSLNQLNGDSFTFGSTKGKVVVISFWATWCKPCIQELGFLKQVQRENEKDLVVLAVATDDPNTISKVRMTVKRKKLTMPVLLDPQGSVMAMLNPRGSLPFSVYIDTQGRVAATHDGFASGDETQITKVIKTLLAEGAAPTVPTSVPEKQAAPAQPAAPRGWMAARALGANVRRPG